MVTTSASARYTEHALRSFFRNTPLQPPDRFILIDNDSDYAGGEFSARTDILKNPAPLGFASNANQAVDLARHFRADLYFLNNDIIFTPDWLDPFLDSEARILTPFTNRELQYDTPLFKASMIMELSDYLGQEDGLDKLAEIHRAGARGYHRILVAPFCAVKLPLQIMDEVGHFDESFGKGGGEDYDYCLRAYLGGFSVAYARSSYVLHFGGKSSWSGVESRHEQDERELKFRAVFGYKWGLDLLKLILFEERWIVENNPELVEEIRQGNQRRVIEVLMGDKKNEIYL